jgi:hypothetical protein
MTKDLTVANFVDRIKNMGERERGKLTAKELIDLIIQIPDAPATIELAELRAAIDHVTKISSVNQTEILALKTSNDDLVKKNTSLNLEITLLKTHAQECNDRQQNRPQPANLPPPPNDDIKKKINEIESELNSIQQYLRVNNLEVVGLPQANNGESDETLLINAFNQLEGLENIVTPEDIDISHPLKSNRRDGKLVHVVRFISRKTKSMILNAKKHEANKQFKFRDNDVFINEHLSKQNRSLFASSQEKKTALNYKYCWTRGGSILMRKTDDSQPITITSEDDLNKLV